MAERKYIAISIKHSTKDDIQYWGNLTTDSEERCFSGYTSFLDKCEKYTLEEFWFNYPRKDNYPFVTDIKSFNQFWKENKNVDTVLVEIEEWRNVMNNEIGKMRKRRMYKGANVLLKGEKVVMHTCLEAKQYDGKIWECMTDSYNENGIELVFLNGFSGAFMTDFLQKVKIE